MARTDRRTRLWRSTGAALLAGGLAVAGLPVLAGPAAATRPVPVTNPDLPLSCGLDVVLVVDASNSVNTANAVSQVRSAATTFLTSFKDTNTRIGLVTFSTKASVTVPLTYATASSTSTGGVHAAAVAAYKAGGRTNWHDATIKTRDAFAAATPRSVPRLVVFITDGAPNEYNGAGGTISTVDADPAAVDPAVVVMNQLKSGGAHTLVVGIGQALDAEQQPVFHSALRRISEFPDPQVYPDTSFSASTTDIILESEFAGLKESLRGIASQVCDGSLIVTQYASSADAPNTFRSGGGGWRYVTDVTPVGHWVRPSVSASGSEVLTTDTGGSAVAQWNDTDPGWSKTASVEALGRADFATERVQCKVNGAAVVDPVLTDDSFTIGVGAGKTVACSVYSRYTGALTTSLPLSVGSPTTYGAKTKVRGVAKGPLGVLPGATVTLQTRRAGTSTWGALATVKADSSGHFSRAVTASVKRQFRAVFAGTAAQKPATSAAVTLAVAPRVELKVSDTSVARGEQVRFRGKVAPGLAGKTVKLQRRVGNRWHTVDTTTLSQRSRYRFVVTMSSSVDRRWRVVRPASTAYAEGRSATVKVSVG